LTRKAAQHSMANTTATPTYPFKISVVDPAGITMVSDTAGDPVASRPLTIRRGQSYEITEAIRNANVDRNGNSFLDLTEEQQLERWKRVRWAIVHMERATRPLPFIRSSGRASPPLVLRRDIGAEPGRLGREAARTQAQVERTTTVRVDSASNPARLRRGG
jgi:hypothetical protein